MKTKKTFQGYTMRQVGSIIKFFETLKNDGRVSMSKVPKGIWFRDWLKGMDIVFGYSKEYKQYITRQWIGRGQVIQLLLDDFSKKKLDSMLRSYRNQLHELQSS